MLDATGGKGASHVLELGGPDTFDRSVGSVGVGGTIVQVGVLTGVDPAPHLRRLMWQNANIAGVTVGSADHLSKLSAFFADHALSPVIDRRFGFDEAPEAMEHLRGGTHFGKVVIGW